MTKPITLEDIQGVNQSIKNSPIGFVYRGYPMSIIWNYFNFMEHAVIYTTDKFGHQWQTHLSFPATIPDAHKGQALLNRYEGMINQIEASYTEKLLNLV